LRPPFLVVSSGGIAASPPSVCVQAKKENVHHKHPFSHSLQKSCKMQKGYLLFCKQKKPEASMPGIVILLNIGNTITKTAKIWKKKMEISA